MTTCDGHHKTFQTVRIKNGVPYIWHLCHHCAYEATGFIVAPPHHPTLRSHRPDPPPADRMNRSTSHSYPSTHNAGRKPPPAPAPPAPPAP